MSKNPSPLQTDIFGRVHGTSKVFAVDGSVLPSLPSQNLTFTIMANAHRIATEFGLKNEEEKLKH
jgi:choline dehydrogenase-like flavoprotein